MMTSGLKNSPSSIQPFYSMCKGRRRKGHDDTLAGAVDIGMISRAIKPEEEAKVRIGSQWPRTRSFRSSAQTIILAI